MQLRNPSRAKEEEVMWFFDGNWNQAEYKIDTSKDIHKQIVSLGYQEKPDHIFGLGSSFYVVLLIEKKKAPYPFLALIETANSTYPVFVKDLPCVFDLIRFLEPLINIDNGYDVDDSTETTVPVKPPSIPTHLLN